jgi:hypothetical protein
MQAGTPLATEIRVCQSGAESARSSAKPCGSMAERCSLFWQTVIRLQRAFAHPAEWHATGAQKTLLLDRAVELTGQICDYAAQPCACSLVTISRFISQATKMVLFVVYLCYKTFFI